METRVKMIYTFVCPCGVVQWSLEPPEDDCESANAIDWSDDAYPAFTYPWEPGRYLRALMEGLWEEYESSESR